MTAMGARPGPTSVLIGIGATLYMALRTLWPVPKGLADNGDGPRYACQLGVVPAVGEPRYFDYALLDWIPGQEGGACIGYPSSEVWILRVVQSITELSGGPEGSLNLRWLIAANAVLVGLLVALFAFLLRRGLGTRVLMSAAMLLVIGDPAFSNYAGSVYGEYPGLVGVAVLGIGAIYLGTSGARQYIGLLLVGAGAVLALTSKTQGITLLAPVAVMLVFTTLRWRVRIETRPWWAPVRLLRTITGKAIPLALVAALVLPVTWIMDNNPKEFQAINPWELIAVAILGNSDDPAADLQEMGFPPTLDKYAGKSVWDGDSIMNHPEWNEYKHLMTYGTAAEFLLDHPGRALVIANNAGNDFLAARPDYLGSYAPDSGKSVRTTDYSLVTDISRQMDGLGMTPLLLVAAGIVTGAVLLWRRSIPGTIRRGFAMSVLVLVGCAGAQYVTASFGEAIENTKHMVYGILAFAMAPVVLAAGALVTRRGDEVPDEALPAAAEVTAA